MNLKAYPAVCMHLLNVTGVYRLTGIGMDRRKTPRKAQRAGKLACPHECLTTVR